MALLWAGVVVGLTGCAAAPPERPEDACAIFEERRSWFRAAEEAEARWQVPVGILLAFIHQESSFKANARPPRQRFLWILPGPRPSSAYGYAQALDGTWADYQEATDRPRARRNDFDDAADFIAWYNARSARRLGIARDDAYRLYLAYHEGPGGYAKGTYRDKEWLLQAARRVEQRARRYEQQYARCYERLDRPWWRRLFGSDGSSLAAWGRDGIGDPDQSGVAPSPSSPETP